MVNNDRLSRLAQQLGERLQGASHAPEELQRGVQQVLRGAFDRMELVSREDFDILMDVLQRTRARVEALEKQVTALEAALETRPSVTAPAQPQHQVPQEETPPAEDAGAGEASESPVRKS